MPVRGRSGSNESAGTLDSDRNRVGTELAVAVDDPVAIDVTTATTVGINTAIRYSILESVGFRRPASNAAAISPRAAYAANAVGTA